MVSTHPNDLFSLELRGSLTAVQLHIVAHRPATPEAPALDIDVTLTLTAEQLAGLTAETLAALLQAALFPPVTNAPPGETLPGDDDRFATTGCGTEGTTGELDSRCSSSVFVWASGGLFLIGFRGELVGLDVAFTATPEGAGTATDLLRTDGITYDTLETLDISLGSGDDRFNVRGTLPHTLLDTGPGDDVVFVSDAADLGALPAALPLAGRDLEALHEAVLHGTVTYDDLTFHGSLDEIDGDLDIDAGAGSNTLAVSDHADPDADTGFVIDDHSITGLADGAMTYTATGGDLAGQGAWTRLHDAGMFGRGITIHLGTGSDSGTIDSVRGGAIASSPFGATVTTVYANQGADDITVDAPVVAAALLVVHGDDGDDTIDAATSSLPVVVFGDAGSDTITGGSGNDQLFGDDARVHYVKPAAAAGFDVVFGGDPDGSLLPAVLDAVFLTPDLLLTRDTTIGSGDTIDAGLGNDIVLGGRGSDTVHGDGGNDLILGDFGRVATRIAGGFVDATLLPLSQEVAIPPVRVALDRLHQHCRRRGRRPPRRPGRGRGARPAGRRHDLRRHRGRRPHGRPQRRRRPGCRRPDRRRRGRRRRARRQRDDPPHRIGAVRPLPSSLNGTIASWVTGDPRLNPTGVEARDITLFDHPGAPGTSGTSGDDYIAGGPDDDVIFGQIGNDTIQGDGDIDIVNAPSPCAGVGTGVGACRAGTELPVNASRDRASDGDDYIEGNGGNDVIFGNQGQDDIVGGNSGLFGLLLASERPDGEDLIFGGSGTRIALDDPGDVSTTGHARDADVILGDNGAIYRLIGPGGQFLQFNYDSYGPEGTLKVIPRAVVLLDYSPTGDAQYVSTNPADQAVSTPVTNLPPNITNVGAGDFLHGEAGDDIIHGQTGSDRIWGEGQSDDLYGESGFDWISGGTGVDGILGDDGLLFTSRNGTAEPLYGIAVATQTTLTLNGDQQDTVINVTGALNKAADLEPFYIGHNDVVYGGLGSDFMHGGAGDDAMSGAEALAFYYVGDPLALLAQYYLPGNVLQHGFRDPEELPLLRRERPVAQGDGAGRAAAARSSSCSTSGRGWRRAARPRWSTTAATCCSATSATTGWWVAPTATSCSAATATTCYRPTTTSTRRSAPPTRSRTTGRIRARPRPGRRRSGTSPSAAPGATCRSPTLSPTGCTTCVSSTASSCRSRRSATRRSTGRSRRGARGTCTPSPGRTAPTARPATRPATPPATASPSASSVWSPTPMPTGAIRTAAPSTRSRATAPASATPARPLSTGSGRTPTTARRCSCPSPT